MAFEFLEEVEVCTRTLSPSTQESEVVIGSVGERTHWK